MVNPAIPSAGATPPAPDWHDGLILGPVLTNAPYRIVRHDIADWRRLSPDDHLPPALNHPGKA